MLSLMPSLPFMLHLNLFAFCLVGIFSLRHADSGRSSANAKEKRITKGGGGEGKGIA